MSRIFAPVDNFPIPHRNMLIDVQLKCGSRLIGCKQRIFENSTGRTTSVINWLDGKAYIDHSAIVSWREHKDASERFDFDAEWEKQKPSIKKDEITIDWPTESGFSFGSDK